MTTIDEARQLFHPGELVLLYRIDLTRLGGPVSRFTPSVVTGGAFTFDGNAYTAAAVETEGFERSTRKENGRPILRMGKSTALLSLMATYHDLVGGILYRDKTLSRFLDGEADADPTAILDSQVWRISRKAQVNNVFVEWELASPLDQPVAMVPKGQCIKTHCRAIYRRHDPTDPEAAPDGFVYDATTLVCPYEGTSYFDITDQAVAGAADDRCSKTLGGCRARFGQNAILPFMAHPAIGEVR